MAKKNRFLDPTTGRPSEQRIVPFLRPFEWVATALTSFREKPLPSAYTPTAIPTFDLFGSSRLVDFEVEFIQGGLGSIEVVGQKVPVDKYRIYLSVDCFHNDVVDHKLLFSRVVPDPTLGFPILIFATSLKGVTANEHVAVENILVPPDGRIECLASIPATMNAGSRLELQNMFIEMDLGEPAGGVIP